MADRDQLRQILLSKALRRTLFVLFAAIATWFIVSSLQQGRVADRCAGMLLDALRKKDRTYLAEHVRSPSLEEELIAAPYAELGFVRPTDPDWSRIGILIRESETSSVAKPVFILLSHEHSKEECSFMQDYEQ